MLAAAGWAVQDAARVEPRCGARRRRPRVRPRSRRTGAPTTCSSSTAQAVGVIEAKKEGETLTGVEWQTREVRRRAPGRGPDRARGRAAVRLRVHRRRDPLHERARPRAASREVFSFHRPETLAGWIDDEPRAPDGADAPPPAAHAAAARRRRASGRRRTRAIRNLEESLADEPPARADPDGDRLGQDLHRRERRLPARQARRRAPRPVPRRPRQPRPPDAEGVPGLRDARTTAASSPSSTTSSTSPRTAIDPVARVMISTIQRLYSILRGEAELDPELDEHSAYDVEPDRAGRRSPTTRRVPIETFDVDHRRRVPPLDLRRLAAGARLLRRLPRSGSPRRRTSRRSASSTRTS